VDLSGGAFAEYYPFAFVRTRVEAMQGIRGTPEQFLLGIVGCYQFEVAL
jgi:hypothetical protein